MSKSIRWVCNSCGTQHGKYKATVSTWHFGICDICGKPDSVTEGRDYGIYDYNGTKVLNRFLKRKAVK